MKKLPVRTAFVLGAGLGTRLRPLTASLPKPLLPVGGRPLITWAFDHCLTAGVERFIVNTHHCPAAYGEAFPDSRWRGRPILFRYEPVLLDTAGGLKNIEDLLDEEGPLLVYNGDILSDLPLSRLLAAHAAGRREVTLALRSEGPLKNVALDAAEAVCDLRDLLGIPGVRRCQFTGISVVEKMFLSRLVPDRVASTIPALALMIREVPGSVGGAVIDAGLWLDIGDKESYGRLQAGPALAYEAGAGARVGARSPLPAADGEDRSGLPGLAAGVAPSGGDGAKGGPAPGGTAGAAAGTDPGKSGAAESEPAAAAVAGGPGEGPAGKAITEFVRAALGLPADAALSLTAVGKGGSDRTYWRVAAAGRPAAVLMRYGRFYSENDGWTAAADFLEAAGVAVPARYVCHPRRRLILLEDLGDTDLFSLRDAPWERRRGLYEKTLALAARLHALSPERLPAGLKLMPGFDADLYRWERDYFRERFVRDVCRLEPAGAAAAELEAELAALAGRLLATPVCLIHRDFQSQNVMLRRGEEPVLIDFQGLRPGNPCYDLASLLWDPYVTFPAGSQAALLAFYRATAAARGDEEAFRRTFLAAAAQRLMQALGAYGFLGLVRGKPHFLAHIPRALENLIAVTERAGDLPRLHALAKHCRRAMDERDLLRALSPAGTATGEEASGLTGDRTGPAGASAPGDETPPGGKSR